MGSKGMKHDRKGGSRHHLPKVGERDELREEQHLERQAIADTMGFSGAPAWVKTVGLLVVALIVIAAVVTFIGYM